MCDLGLEILSWDLSLGRDVHRLHQETRSQIHTSYFGFTTTVALVKTQKGLKLLIKKGTVNPIMMD